jgi:hypothetical protein
MKNGFVAILLGCLALTSVGRPATAKEKVMRKKILSMITVMNLCLVFIGGAPFIADVWAQTAKPKLPPPPTPVVWDFSLRSALYANGAETKKVNTQAKYVSAGKTLTLKKSEAVSCEGDSCTFNLGFIVFRNGDQGVLSTYASIRSTTLGIVGNTVTFENGSKVKDAVFASKLKLGENKLTVEVDPYKKTAETNEGNNSFQVTIIVEP